MLWKEQVMEMTVLEFYYQPEAFYADLAEAPEKRGPKKKDSGDSGAMTGWYERFLEHKYKALYHLGFLTKQPWMTPSVEYLYRLSALFIRRISSSPELELVREAVDAPLTGEDTAALMDELPFVNGGEFVNEEWLRGLWGELLSCFRQEITVYDGTAAAYFAEQNTGIHVAGRVFFHLVESHEEEYPFAFMATYSTKPVKSKKAIHTPLKHALMEFKDDQKKLLSLLSAVAKAADQSGLIAGLMDSGELFQPIRLTSDEAYTFLKEIPLYESAGIMCRVPDWWRKSTNAIRLSLSVGEKKRSSAGLEAMVDFSPSLLIDGEELTQEQLTEFLQMAEGLMQYKGKWVEINRKKLEAALSALNRAKEAAKDGELSLAEAMRLELTLNEGQGEEAEAVEVSVSNGRWLKKIRELLTNPAAIDPIPLEPGVHAALRGYQEEGYRWLNLMAELGFGACLADDMGLGKTVQVIAWLEHYRVHRGGRALLVVPASLIGNWQKEIEKFAPGLSYCVLHKSAEKGGGGRETGDEEAFLTVTTYGMVSRLETLSDARWDIMILDEAQAIKNPGTKQSKSVKAIPSGIRIAMTGTPIENNLGDLWSLFDFLNQGLLGSAKEFGGLVKRISEEPSGYLPLKKMVNPFILRRLKTDRSIISDLPDKVEIREYAGLSKKQTALYRKLVKEVEEKLREGDSDGIARKGLVLAAIMKFKQICNHPDQYLGLDEFKRESSGKFECLGQICETIYEKRERVLVFTQFKEMTEPLADYLETIFHRRGLVLHGGTPVKQRSRLVETFNGEAYVPYMVLSLKAGGVGLNLTAANHVVHFDRWWNPAVENQATDRVFRIGQKKNVFVHKFVTQGTIEEKIDAMIEEKQKLAVDILGSAGEQWITELGNDELMELFRLGGGKG